MACSSAKICLSVFAMNVANEDEDEELVGIWFGV
jgi:hypothetical protein